MQISEIMTENPDVCTTSTSLRDVARIMHDHDCGSVPVVEDMSSHKLVGMITDRDIAMAACEHDKPLSKLRVDRVMTTEIARCKPDDSLADAEHTMQRLQVRRLPVVEGNNLVGLLTLAQIARRAVDGAGDGESLSPREVGETLGAISQPTSCDTGSA